MPSSLNGTGVTFNDGSTLQSGNIPAANLGSGTADSNTFLRGDRTFATPPSQAPTTAQVLSAYAGAAYGAIGTYTVAFSQSTNNNQELSANTTIAGSSLRRQSTSFNHTVGASNVQFNADLTGLGLSGTWRLMMPLRNAFGSGVGLGGLYLRIS